MSRDTACHGTPSRSQIDKACSIAASHAAWELRVAPGDIDHHRSGGTSKIVTVREGAIKLVGHFKEDRTQIVAFAFVGDALLIPANADNKYSLHALTESRISFSRAKDILSHMGSDAGPSKLDPIFADLERSRDMSIMLGCRSARERICIFLLNMVDRIGTREAAVVVLDLPMSRREVGDFLGLTIETVSRQVTELRACGIIRTIGRSRIEILNLQALHDVADPTV